MSLVAEMSNALVKERQAFKAKVRAAGGPTQADLGKIQEQKENINKLYGKMGSSDSCLTF